MSDDREILAAPVMRVVPALICIPEAAIDTMGDAQGIVIGAQHLDGFGPCLFIGSRMSDGKAQIGAIPPEHWPRLAEVLNETFGALHRGDFDNPAVRQ